MNDNWNWEAQSQACDWIQWCFVLTKLRVFLPCGFFHFVGSSASEKIDFEANIQPRNEANAKACALTPESQMGVAGLVLCRVGANI